MELKENEHQPALDGVRGIAIASVLVCHLSTLVPTHFGPPLLKIVAGYGWAGVDLFFVLSGFLITRILLRTAGSSNYLGSFWIRRALRILPVYFLTLTAVLAIGDRIGLRAVLPDAEDRPLYFFFLTNWASLRHTWGTNALGQLWSLAVEEQFYLAWPFCVLFISRRGLQILTLVLAAGAFAIRTHVVVTHGPMDFLSFITITRADGLALGAFAATLAMRAPSKAALRFASRTSALAGIAFVGGSIALATYQRAFIQTAGYSLLAMCFACLVWYVAAAPQDAPAVRLFRNATLSRLGTYSYGMYLFHLPLIEGFRSLIVAPSLARWHADGPFVAASIVALWAITYYLAKMSYHVLEAPMLSLKRFAVPGRPAVSRELSGQTG